jgi:double-stranded uracil-DNA glycosylase
MLDLAAHVGSAPDAGAPLRLWELRQRTDVGTTATMAPDPTSTWPPDLLDAVLEGGGWEPHPDGNGNWHRRLTLADTVGPNMQLLLVGLNPSVYSAEVGVGFARPGNRFWPAALRAGIVTKDRDPLDALTSHGIGMTDMVKRATARADELGRDEYSHGLARLSQLVAWLEPGAVCVVGLAGWRSAVDRKAVAGVQPIPLGGHPVYLMPNPSGLNAHATVDSLADHLRAARDLAAEAGQRGARSRMA